MSQDDSQNFRSKGQSAHLSGNEKTEIKNIQASSNESDLSEPDGNSKAQGKVNKSHEEDVGRSSKNSQSQQGNSSGFSDFKATHILGEAAKKLFSAGVSAAFMTEENIRSYLAEVKLPKEMLNLIIQGASKSKDEITARVSKEVVALIEKVDWANEASKFVENHKFKISAEFEVLKKNDSSGKKSQSGSDSN